MQLLIARIRRVGACDLETMVHTVTLRTRLVASLTCLAIGMVLCGCVSSSFDQDVAGTAGLQSVLDRELEVLRMEYELPGATAAVVLPDGAVMESAVGLSDQASAAAMTAQSVFLSASNGKSIVAAVALDLVNQGRLSLDEPVAPLFQQEAWYAGLPNANVITMRMLLGHTSGIPNHVEDEDFRRDMTAGIRADPDFAPSPIQSLSYLSGHDPLFDAGEGYAYSDSNYLLAGLVIERVSSTSFYDLARRRLLEPLALEMHIFPSDNRNIPNLATGYWDDQTNYFNLDDDASMANGVLVYNPLLEWTGGGFAATSQGLALWTKNLYEGCALNKAYLDDLFVSSKAGEEPPTRYGLGVYIVKSPIGKFYGHSGGIPGYSSAMLYFPDHGFAVAWQTNVNISMMGPTLQLAAGIAAALPDEQSRKGRVGSCVRTD